MKSTEYWPTPSQKYCCIGNASPSNEDCSGEQTSETPPRSEPPRGLLDAFVSGKLRIIEAAIEEVTADIETRVRLNDQTIAEIDKAICAHKELLYQVAPCGSSPFTIGDSRRRSAIEKELVALDAEKRAETTTSWRDIAALKKELRVLLREQLEEKRRQQVIGE